MIRGIGALARLLFVQILQLTQTMTSVSAAITASKIDIVEAILFRCGGAGNLTSEFLKTQIQYLQIEHQIVTNFEVCGRFDLHALAVKAQACRVDRGAKQARQPWAMDFHPNGAVAANLKLSSAGQLLSLIRRIFRRLVS